MRRLRLIALAAALVGVTALPASATGAPITVRPAVFVPTIDDEPRIAGFPMVGGYLIGVEPGQRDLLIAAAVPRVSASAPTNRDFFRCSAGGTAEVGIPGACSHANGYSPYSIYGELHPTTSPLLAHIGLWYRYGIKIDGTWRLSAAIGPITAAEVGAPKNILEPWVADGKPNDGRDTFYVGNPINFYRGFSAYGGTTSISIYLCSTPAAAQVSDGGVRGCARVGSGLTYYDSIPSTWSGKYVRLRRVTGNSYGSQIVWSATSPQIQAPPSGILPELLTPPALFDDPEVGAELYASRGIWKEYDNSDPSYPPIAQFTYAWYRCSVILAAAEALSSSCQEATTIIKEEASASATQFYVPTLEDVGWRLTFSVTAFNGNGSRTLYTATSAVVPQPPLEAPVNVEEPYIFRVTNIQVDNKKTYMFYENQGLWTGFPTPDIAMVGLYRCSGGWGAATPTPSGCTLASTSAEYKTIGTDGGYRFRAKYIASNTEGSVTLYTATSDPVPILIPTNIGGPAAPIVTSWAKPGATVTASRGTWSGLEPTYTYQWLLCTAGGSTTPTTKPSDCTTINRATATTLSLSTAQKGKYLRVIVTGKNNFGTATRVSAAVGPISDPPISTVAPTASGSVSAGATLTASPGAWTNTPTYTYSWYRCSASGTNTPSDTPSGCILISGASSASYQIAADDIGSYLRVRVAALNAGGLTIRFSRTTVRVP